MSHLSAVCPGMRGSRNRKSKVYSFLGLFLRRPPKPFLLGQIYREGRPPIFSLCLGKKVKHYAAVFVRVGHALLSRRS